MPKPRRSLEPVANPLGERALKLYGASNDKVVVQASDSESHYIDVVSLGPVGGIKAAYFDETKFSSEITDIVGPVYGPFTFPRSTVFFHDGEGAEKPWTGNYPYAERSYVIGVEAETIDTREYHDTSFIRKVSSKGVVGISLSFTASQFFQSDDQNRRKDASAYFVVDILDSNGDVVKSETTSRGSDGTYYHCRNAIAVTLPIQPPSGYENDTWEYQVTMKVFGKRYGVPVTGKWSCSTVTELYKDTQEYDNIAYSSGTIVSADVSGRIPARRYDIDGYKVRVPVLADVSGTPTWLGEFTQETSNSHAWNTLSVLTDDKWAGDLPIDKMNMDSFLELEEYCAEIVDGDRRHRFSQHLIKPSNYFKLASQMVGTADSKLYEDTAGRVGVLIDKQVSERRVVTSYDIENERVKRTSVPNSKKLNYVQAEFEDAENEYEKTIINVEDDDSIVKNGVIKKEIKLDTVTYQKEADRIIRRMLAVSQNIVESYQLSVGYSHEDVQIGDILEVYDRKYATVNYCGKIGSGSTTNIIEIHPSTPIDLSPIDNQTMTFSLWNGVETIRAEVESWETNTIVLKTDLAEIPETFLSFGVSAPGLQPTLMKVMDITSNKTSTGLQCISYNDSLYGHVDFGDPLIVPITRHVPSPVDSSEIYGLTLTQVGQALQAGWGLLNNYNYNYVLHRQVTDSVGKVTWEEVQAGSEIQSTTIKTFPFPLHSGLYRFTISAVSLNGQVTGQPARITYDLIAGSGGTIPAPTQVGSYHSEDSSIDSTFQGRFFTVGWVMDDPNSDVHEFRLRILQNSQTLDISIEDPTQRQFIVSEQSLVNTFGVDYGRTFILDIYAIDQDLVGGVSTTSSITDASPPLPLIEVKITGDVTLAVPGTGPVGATGYYFQDNTAPGGVRFQDNYSPGFGLTGPLPEDLVRSVVYIWEGTNILDSRPTDAFESRSTDLTNHSLTRDFVIHDGRSYIYEIGWEDQFGDTNNWQRTVVTFNPDAEVPDILDLLEVVPIDHNSVLVRYSHEGTWLRRVQAEYRRVTTNDNAAWTVVADEFEIPPLTGDVTSAYDETTQEGHFVISGLTRNTPYQFRAKAANVASDWSEYSDIIQGSAYPDVIGEVEIGGVVIDVLNGELDDAIDAALGNDIGSDPRDLLVEGVIDAFDDYRTDATVFNETVIRDYENSQRVDSINQIRAEIDDPNGINAKILSTETAIAATDAAFAARVTLVDANFGTTNANIATNSTAIATESSARAADITLVNATLGDNTAEISRIDSAYVTGDSANATAINAVQANLNTESSTRASEVITINQAIVDGDSANATSITNLTATVDSNTADILINFTAIADESSARVAADSVLTASVGTNTSEIASARSEAIAAIGYCEIGGNTSVHETKALCEAATGTWIEAPLASSVNEVTVDNGSGSSATVGSFYSTYIDLEGEVTGNAVIGVDSGGVFTGLEIVGGTNQSKLTFKGDDIEFQESDGTTALSYNSTSNLWEFKGDLSAAGGTFSGDLSAATGTFSGDLSANDISGADIDCFSIRVNNVGTWGYGGVGQAIYASCDPASGAAIGVRGEATGNGPGTPGSGIYGVGIANDDRGVVGFCDSSLTGTTGVIGQAVNGVVGTGTSNDFFASGAGTNYAPFTGSHEGLVYTGTFLSTAIVGDIVCDDELISIGSTSSALLSMSLSNSPMQRNVRGVFSGQRDFSDTLTTPAMRALSDSELVNVKQNYDLIHFNGVGEGVINVVGEGGDMVAGDLICSSSSPGKGMKQADQSVERPYTIAQVRHTVTFSSISEEKQVAVIYLRG